MLQRTILQAAETQVPLGGGKVCSECGDLKMLGEFGDQARGKFGKKAACRKCCADLQKLYATPRRTDLNRKKRESWAVTSRTEDQKQAARDRASAWYYANRERAYKNFLSWVKSHSEEWRVICSRWESKNPEAVTEKVKSWRLRNPGWWQKRRADLAKVTNTLTTEEWLSVLSEFNHSCAYCGRSDAKLTMDHVIPISKGGPHSKENVVPSCSSCNSKKGAKDPSFFKFVIQGIQSNLNGIGV
jgi:5-methylcytosine-specific restriction endonuclease McrA